MYFLDSHAILEMAKGNPRYHRFRSEPSVTSRAHLLEVYYILTHQGHGPLAEACLASLGPQATDLPLDSIPQVARFRRGQTGVTGHRLSYADAFGYVYARENGDTLLTGAHEFEGSRTSASFGDPDGPGSAPAPRRLRSRTPWNGGGRGGPEAGTGVRDRNQSRARGGSESGRFAGIAAEESP
ncbi:MAG: PIN domain-containing protein [Thermoplasmata archaeon]|nr:PIN domain-containing protein [Thermoplasmata archaeon]